MHRDVTHAHGHGRAVLVADHTGELVEAVAQSSPVLAGSEVAEILRLARSARPLAVVVHGDLPPEGGISLLTRLAPLQLPSVLVVSRADAAVVAAALRSGARSVIAAGSSAGRMQRAIEAAVRGELHLAPELASDLSALVDDERVDRHPFPQLSRRERDVLAQLASGADSGRIAVRLGVSAKTVRNQLGRIQSKLGVADGAQAAMLARGAGLGHRRPTRAGVAAERNGAWSPSASRSRTTPAQRPFRVLIADDHPLVRAGVRMLVDRQDDMRCVAEASSAQEAVDAAGACKPDVAVVDLRMPGATGVWATQRIVAAIPAVRVLVLTMHGEQESLSAALCAGARGYALKESGLDDIIRAIRAVGHGEAFFGPAVANHILELFADAPCTAMRAFPDLTEREHEILELLAHGSSNGQIAYGLELSPKTVRNHVSNICNKLRVVDRAQAALRARDAGIGLPSPTS